VDHKVVHFYFYDTSSNLGKCRPILGERYVTFVQSINQSIIKFQLPNSINKNPESGASQFQSTVVCLSSVTLVHPTHGVELFANIFAPRCSVDIWPPWCQTLRPSSDDPTLKAASNAGRVWRNRDFWLISCFVSETILYRAIVTWNANRNSYKICQMVSFSMTFSAMTIFSVIQCQFHHSFYIQLEWSEEVLHTETVIGHNPPSRNPLGQNPLGHNPPPDRYTGYENCKQSYRVQTFYWDMKQEVKVIWQKAPHGGPFPG